MITRPVSANFRLLVLVACLTSVLCGCMAESVPQSVNLTEADKSALEKKSGKLSTIMRPRLD